MKEMILVEYGSSYSSDPWTPKCVCPTESDAEDYIARQSQFASLYHTSKLPVEGEEQFDKQSEYEYILERIKNSEDITCIVEMQQIRCLWTAFCIHHKLEVETHEYEVAISYVWQIVQEKESVSCSFLKWEPFYGAMSAYLV